MCVTSVLYHERGGARRLAKRLVVSRSVPSDHTARERFNSSRVYARVSRGRLVVELKDGRTLLVPLALIPGFDALPRWALSRYELIGGGIGIHLPVIDEDVSVANLLHQEDTMWPKALPSVVAPKACTTPAAARLKQRCPSALSR